MPTATTTSGELIPQIYYGRTRRERHEELVAYAIAGGIQQARVAYERSNGEGRIHMNVLWEMAAAERVLHGVLEGARGLIHGVTCGAGMPYRIAEISARYGVYYYPIVSSARAFRALWKRAYHKFCDWLGGVVYEDPWLAGGHNGLSNSEDPAAARAALSARARAAQPDDRVRPRPRRRSSWPAASGTCANGPTGSTIPSSGRSPSSSARGRC